ncbi:MAG: hypothetical protein AAGD96_20320 [Chloroflexota bacterium]
METSIIQRIQELGESFTPPQEQTLLAQLQVIIFPHASQYLGGLEQEAGLISD